MGRPDYVLGSSEAEIARLQIQATAIAEPTAFLLERGGIAAGMRVLDLGTGPGDVAFQLAELVGVDGSIVGVDQDAAQVAAAQKRLANFGFSNMTFRQGDARSFVDDQPFDAIVCRLLLFHLPDAVEVVAHHVQALPPGGIFMAIDYDLGGMRVLPSVEIFTQSLRRLLTGFKYAQTDPFVGMRLPVILAQAGLENVKSFGIQPYWAPDDASAPVLFSGPIRAMASAIIASGAATEEELDVDMFEERLGEALRTAGAVWTTPTVVGCWGRRAE